MKVIFMIHEAVTDRDTQGKQVKKYAKKHIALLPQFE